MSSGSEISRKKLAAVVVAAGAMVIAAFSFYANSFFPMMEQSRIYEESPDIMVYAENDVYEMRPGDAIQIPIIVEIDQKNKEVSAQVTVFEIAKVNDSYLKTEPDTLPEGFSGHLDRDAIYLPATLTIGSTDTGRPDGSYTGERRVETLLLVLESDKGTSPGQYDFTPTVFTHAIDGSNVMISSSFPINIVA